MSDIVVFGGTSEGRELAEALVGTDLQVHMCVATEYGDKLLPKGANLHVYVGRMDESEMEIFLTKRRASHCLDATHPYAALATENIFAACEKTGIPYIRILRESEPSAIEEHAGVHVVKSAEEAAAFLEKTDGTVLVATGSTELEKFTAIPDYQSRCYVRVLPSAEAMHKCTALGFEGSHIIAMQGPFSEELNAALFRQIGADYVVTKSSGKAGGFQEKYEAALSCGVNLVIIKKPKENDDAGRRTEMNLSEAISFLRETYGVNEMRSISLIGMGPGDPSIVTREAERCLKSCDVVIGAGRVAAVARAICGKPYFVSYRKEEIFEYLKEHPMYRKIALIYSGDIGFYSAAKEIREYLAEHTQSFHCRFVSGIASPVYFLNKLGIPWDTVHLVSCHGKQTNLILRIRRCSRVCALLGGKNDAAKIAHSLLQFGMDRVKITVGENLSYPNERILSGYPNEFIEREFDALSLALFENPDSAGERDLAGIPDRSFLRGSVPMTKQEIRTIVLSKLHLEADSVVYDIGAGTGSISIEAALRCEYGSVFAVERTAEGIDLIRENRKRFGAENLLTVHGEAPEALAGLPVPTHVFIGGSGGRIMEILAAVRAKNPNVRLVMTAVTLETLAAVEKIREAYPEYRDMEVVQINVARGRPLGGYHLMTAENPVTIVCFGKKEGLDGA